MRTLAIRLKASYTSSVGLRQLGLMRLMCAQAKIEKQPMSGKRYLPDEIDLIRQQVLLVYEA
jgi:hypothetical protein